MQTHDTLEKSNDSRWSNRKRSISIGICVLLVSTLSMAAYFSNGAIEVQDPRLVSNLHQLGIALNSPEQDAAVRAWEILDPEVGMVIIDIVRSTSGSETFWSIEFQNQQQEIFTLELDIDNLNVLFINDETNRDDYPRWEINSDQAHTIANQYIKYLVDNAWLEYTGILKPNVYQDSIGWRVSFNHFAQDILVIDDFVAIRINPESGEIYSFCSNMNDIPYLPHFAVDAIDAQIQLNQIYKRDIALQCIPELAIIETTPGYGNSGFEIVWVLSECESNVEYWISAYSGNYIGSNAPLLWGTHYVLPTTVESVFVEIAEDIDNRLFTSYYSIIDTDGTCFDLKTALLNHQIVSFIGHGNREFYDSNPGQNSNFLLCGPVWPSPFPSLFSCLDFPSDPTPAKLFYACACYSGIDDTNTIGRNAILSGIGCYVGWTMSVTNVVAVPYTQYFFDYAVNGRTFEDCKEYADSKTNIDDSWCKLFGDTSLYLSYYDLAPGFVYSTQKYIHYVGLTSWTSPILHEPIWGSDFDAYRKTLTGDHEFNLVVFASPEAMVKVTVYDWRYGYYWIRLSSKECSSPGAYLTFTISWSSSREYLIVVQQTDGHGGWYRLNFDQILS